MSFFKCLQFYLLTKVISLNKSLWEVISMKPITKRVLITLTDHNYL